MATIIETAGLSYETSHQDCMKILVVGHNGSGKSSLINEFVHKKVTRINSQEELTQHKHVAKMECIADGIPVIIYDTCGFGNPLVTNDWKITKSVITEVESVNVVLICHKLYGRVDAVTYNDLKLLAKALGNGLIKHSIFVFTFGDEYQIRHNSAAEESLARQVIEHQGKMESRLKEIMIEVGLDSDIVNRIPSCITSSTLGKILNIQTSTIDNLWKLCRERSSPEAIGFAMQLWNRQLLVYRILGAVIGGTLGAVVGGKVGAVVLGTFIGSIMGAVIFGATFRGTYRTAVYGILGAILGGALGAGVGRIISGAGTIAGGFIGSGIGVAVIGWFYPLLSSRKNKRNGINRYC